MKQTHKKDLYSILGVSPNATAEEIRGAYLAKTRIIHPDRFDQQQQPQDWKKANEMLAELNEAYSILRNAETRSKYDDLRTGRYQQQTPPPSSERESGPPPHFALGELTAGQIAFSSLPEKVQLRLIKRQKNKDEEQFQIKLYSLAWNYLFIVILLCWYVYLVFDADGAKWKNDTLLWYGVITLAVGGLIGRNCITIIKWTRSKLKPYFYITPIYFLKTEFDIISFRPIWTLKDVSVTHNYKNGFYQNSEVVLKFDGYNESLSLSSKNQVETFFDRMRTYDARLRSAYANSDFGYFLDNDDFYRIPRQGVPTNDLLSKGKTLFVYVISVIVCGIGLIATVAANEDLSQKNWIRHPTPSIYTPQQEQRRVVTPSYPEQTLPYSGAIQTWTSSKRVAPFEIKAAKGSNYLLKLVDVYTDSPIMTVFVRSGTNVEVEVPLGTYEVRYAAGEKWYGYEYLFGPETSYSKAENTFTFEIVGNQISGFTITLYKVAHGNLHTSAIGPTEF